MVRTKDINNMCLNRYNNKYIKNKLSLDYRYFDAILRYY